MSKIRDLVGQKFGKLLVVSVSNKKTKSGGLIWNCKCECGVEKEIASTALVSGQQTCGICIKKKVDVGSKFGNLTVIETHHNEHTHKKTAICMCDCGNTISLAIYGLLSGSTKSCGCLQKKRAADAHLTHGKTNTKEYRAYRHMKYRCTDPNNKDYHNYGGRGISVCERWMESFEKFYADMGDAPSPKHQLDRIDVNANYELSNCRWVTPKEQQNNRRNNRRITYQGENKTVSEWADYFGIDASLISGRLYRGLKDEALFCSYDRRFKHRHPVWDGIFLDYIEHADKTEKNDIYIFKVAKSAFDSWKSAKQIIRDELPYPE